MLLSSLSFSQINSMRDMKNVSLWVFCLPVPQENPILSLCGFGDKDLLWRPNGWC